MKYFPYTDAYLLNTVNSLLKETNNEGFDIIIDDGSHSPVNQAFVIVEYGKILKSGGILIIEDVSDISIFNYLSEMPISYPAHFKSVDFRNVKGRQDDLLLVVEKL